MRDTSCSTFTRAGSPDSLYKTASLSYRYYCPAWHAGLELPSPESSVVSWAGILNKQSLSSKSKRHGSSSHQSSSISLLDSIISMPDSQSLVPSLRRAPSSQVASVESLSDSLLARALNGSSEMKSESSFDERSRGQRSLSPRERKPRLGHPRYRKGSLDRGRATCPQSARAAPADFVADAPTTMRPMSSRSSERLDRRPVPLCMPSVNDVEYCAAAAADGHGAAKSSREAEETPRQGPQDEGAPSTARRTVEREGDSGFSSPLRGQQSAAADDRPVKSPLAPLPRFYNLAPQCKTSQASEKVPRLLLPAHNSDARETGGVMD